MANRTHHKKRYLLTASLWLSLASTAVAEQSAPRQQWVQAQPTPQQTVATPSADENMVNAIKAIQSNTQLSNDKKAELIQKLLQSMGTASVPTNAQTQQTRPQANTSTNDNNAPAQTLVNVVDNMQNQGNSPTSAEDDNNPQISSDQSSSDNTQDKLPQTAKGPYQAGMTAPLNMAGGQLTKDLSSESQEKELAFNDVQNEALPMSPSQIKRLHKRYDETERAIYTTPYVPPQPTSTSLIVSLSPGSVPPVIRLSQGFVSSLVFVDRTGQPWPIAAYDLGDPGSFSVKWDKKGNTLMVQALKQYNYGNLAIQLQGLSTPIVLTLIPGQKKVDYRVDLRVSGLGPNADMSQLQESAEPGKANPILLGVLDGVPPKGSKPLESSEEGTRIWGYKDKLYVRTIFTLLSPSWVSMMSSPDGTKAYELNVTPILLLSEHGKAIQVKVEGL